MQALLLPEGQPPEVVADPSQRPESGVLWLDFVRDDGEDWPALVERLSGITVLRQHVIDGNNARHPSHYDGTTDYDLLIFQGLGPDPRADEIETRTAAFFMFDNLLVTVRARDNVSFDTARSRINAGTATRLPHSPVGVAHYVLDVMVDRYLAIREPLGKALDELSEALVDPENDFSDWKMLLRYRKQARKLEALSDGQTEALDLWRRTTRFEFTESQTVRVNDLVEHIARVQSHAAGKQADVESAVQLHFSAVAHATNQTVTTLTVLSAVFLPLGLIAGIFGMNFENMPELKYPHAYPIALGGMVTLAIVLLLVFRRRGYF